MKIVIAILFAAMLANCATHGSIGHVPNDGFPSNTYNGYPNESHDAN